MTDRWLLINNYGELYPGPLIAGGLCATLAITTTNHAYKATALVQQIKIDGSYVDAPFPAINLGNPVAAGEHIVVAYDKDGTAYFIPEDVCSSTDVQYWTQGNDCYGSNGYHCTMKHYYRLVWRTYTTHIHYRWICCNTFGTLVPCWSATCAWQDEGSEKTGECYIPTLGRGTVDYGMIIVEYSISGVFGAAYLHMQEAMYVSDDQVIRFGTSYTTSGARSNYADERRMSGQPYDYYKVCGEYVDDSRCKQHIKDGEDYWYVAGRSQVVQCYIDNAHIYQDPCPCEGGSFGCQTPTASTLTPMYTCDSTKRVCG